MKMNKTEQKGRAAALLPIGIFLALFLGSGLLTGDFDTLPAIVGFLIALIVAFLQNRGLRFEEKLRVIAKGVGDENIITMCLIFLCAGGFSGAVTAAGGVESTVNLGLSVLPAQAAVVGLFVIGCLISVSMGTSMGTIAALAPIAVGISEKTGYGMPVCIGAVVCGAMFGDNLSMISDTTIAAVKTQGCRMKDKFRENFLIVLPAAVVTVVIFLVLTRDAGYAATDGLIYNIWQVLPYVLVLAGALTGGNVFVVLIGGTILSLAVGILTGSLAYRDIFRAVGDGVTGMYDITVISIVVSCIVALVREYGGICFVLMQLKKRIKSRRGAQLGIAALAFLTDVCTANNTVAIVMAGPIAKEIADEYGVEPRKSASLLDIFSSAGQGILPYGAQLLSAATLTGLNPYQIMPYLYYPALMALSAMIFILLGSDKNRKGKRDERSL